MGIKVRPKACSCAACTADRVMRHLQGATQETAKRIAQAIVGMRIASVAGEAAIERRDVAAVGNATKTMIQAVELLTSAIAEHNRSKAN